MLDLISGRSHDTLLPHRILNLMLFLAIVAGVFFSVTDALLSQNFANYLFDAGLLLFFGTFYGLSRFRRAYALVAHLASISGLLFYTYNFFVNSGIHGPTLIVVVMILSLVTLWHSTRVSLAYFLGGILLVIVCLVIEFEHPEWITGYRTRPHQYLDIFFTFIFCATMLFFVMRMMMLFFEETLARKQAEQAALLQQDKMAALGEILANMGHELSTPIGVIGSSLSVTHDWWTRDLPHAAKLLAQLNAEQVVQFWSYLQRGVEAGSGDLPDSRTQRVQRAQLVKILEEAQVPEAAEVAEELVSLHIPEWEPAWKVFFEDEAGRQAFTFVSRSLTLHRANRNSALAYEKIRKLLGALSAYSRSESPEQEPVPTVVTEGLDTVLTLYGAAHKNSIEMTRHYGAIPPLLAKPDELIQVWTNLVQNALQAMQFRGTLEISVEALPGWVQVSIADSGPGVPPELRDRIFEPFFTTKDRGAGTGLGLGIVTRIVSAHGGQVSLHDTPGGGATFRVRLPFERLKHVP